MHSIKLFGRLTHKGVLKLTQISANSQIYAVAQLHSVKIEGQPEQLYKPWDYENRPYRFYHQFYEHTTKRFTDNSKVIIVEGGIGTPREELAKNIAEEFGMLYIPDVKEEEYFLNKKGFDQRELNPRLGVDRFYDLKDLYTAKNPKDVIKYGKTQIQMLRLRFYNYVAGIRHLLNTGQGVVLNRSLWSDRVFADALARCGYFTREGKQYYNKVYKRVSLVLPVPHLMVYIDCNVKEVKDLIAKRNHPLEKNSPLLTDKYLSSMEESYKQNVIPFQKVYGEFMQVDLDDVANFSKVAQEMAHLVLDPPIVDDYQKFDDWYMEKEWKFNYLRQMTATDDYFEKAYWLNFQIPFSAPELMTDDNDLYDRVVNQHPSLQYAEGFDPAKDNVWFKHPKTKPLIYKRLNVVGV